MSFELTDDSKYKYSLLKNVTQSVAAPCAEGKSYLTRGNFDYFHYSCDDVNDVVSRNMGKETCCLHAFNFVIKNYFVFIENFYWFLCV